MQSTAASLGVAGDADGHPRESAPTIDDSLHSSSDAYALADEEKTSQQSQQQHQEREQPSYYPPAATNMQRSSSSATAKTTTTTAPTHSAKMSREPTDREPAGPNSMGERRGPASDPPWQEDYGARHFDIEEEERETGWGLPGPVERPMLRALCLPCAWCLGLCNKGSAYGCLY